MKQLYGAAALGVAAVLFAGISGTEVLAQDMENAANKTVQGAFEYLYLGENQDANEVKIMIQLGDGDEIPESAQLRYHYEGNDESEIVEASQITERTVTFTQECDDIAKTTVLDAVTWLESDTLYTVEFQENQIEIAGNGVQSENTAVLYLADGSQKEITVSEEPTIEEIQEAAVQPAPETVVKEEVQVETNNDSYTGGELFTDVKKENWFYPAVSYVMNKGLMTGMVNGGFAPNEELSKVQSAVILYRMEGSPEVSLSANTLSIPENAYYAPAVFWADQTGLLDGFRTASIKPEDQITREEMITMLFRYAQQKGFDTQERADLSQFADAEKVSPSAKEAVSWAVATGMISGEGKDRLLNPQGSASRAVCAAMITHLCETYMPDAFADIPIYAKANNIAFTSVNQETGDFTVTVSGITASDDVKKVEVALWRDSNQGDIYWYPAVAQGNGVYTVKGNVINHKLHFGLYQAQAYVTLANGLRIPAGTQSGTIEGSETQIRISNHVNEVYDQVGHDLYACYKWVVDNVSYKKLPIPVEPKEGYTADQWYAVLAFENHQGNCFCYAGAFYQLAKGLGYDAKYVEGKVAMAAGGYGPHGWVEITKDGATYICDPDMQDEAPRYNFYMQPANSPVIKYVR
ncbi:GBS Bsp-like repeat-containing protein [Anaerotignum lactatifermentans]|uniref:GBS Bsp-like repeat-containing protein n=1 Tax=Anaerotignum lactatifermentans TaxID=160404 RepID=UPI0030810257